MDSVEALKTQLPGVKTEDIGVDTTRRKDGDRIYAISRRLAQRVTDLEEQVRILRTTLARIDRRDYRAVEVKNKGNGSGPMVVAQENAHPRLDPALFGGEDK